ATVSVGYRFFLVSDIIDDEVQPGTPFGRNGLVNVAGGMVYVFAGAHHGPVDVSIDVRDDPAPLDGVGDWDDVVEVSVADVRHRLKVCNWDGGLPAPDLPELTAAGPGDYRLRVHARHRDPGEHRPPEAPREEFLIACWPAPPAEDIAYKLTDEVGAQYRAATERELARQRMTPEERVALARQENEEARKRIYDPRGQQAVAEQQAKLADALARLGPEHPDTLKLHRSLISPLAWLQQWDQAIEHARIVIDIGSRVLGPAHFETLAARQSLAEVWTNMGNWD
ncbi:MAG: tetratricopeptide repeat protein, partial [Sciscionella sp.]|nr:tetratricopeptide repeat protein [Sciscionella sp.]